MSEWYETPEGLLAAAWAALAAKPGPEVALATVSPDGWPEARTVILRGADRAAGLCEVHTDRGSSKMDSLRATPRAALVLWDPGPALQIRMQGGVEILTGAETRSAWDKVPDRSQTAYGKRPSPGTVIPDALAYDLTPGPEAFAILRLTVQQIDVVHLGADHRRAAFAREDAWRGRWLSP